MLQRLQILLLLFYVYVGYVKAESMTITGCTNAYIRLTCPNGNNIKVQEVIMEEPNGYPCTGYIKEKAPPKGFSYLCPNHECSYTENVCSGMSDCIFKVNPQKMGNMYPTSQSVAKVKYSCSLENDMKVILIVIGVLAAILFIVVLVLFVFACKQVSKDSESYDMFSDTPSISRTSSIKSESKQPAQTNNSAGDGGNDIHGIENPTMRYNKAAPEHVSVTLESPNNNDSTIATDEKLY